MTHRTAIIMINWNGWRDTIDCLKSFSFPLAGTHLFIVDNASQDDSIQQLSAYCTNASLAFQVLSPAQLATHFNSHHAITIVQNDRNAGFAGGNNVVLRFLVQQPTLFRFAWLLNNDTTILPDSQSKLEEKFDTDSSIAFCGSVILDYYKPTLVQCCGVNHYKYLGVSKLYLKDQVWEQIRDTPAVKNARQAYQNGASLMVAIDKLPFFGIMDERYFLYSEEADWQFQAGKKGFQSVLADQSVIFHKGSVSTVNQKHLFFYHYNRSSIIMTRKNFGLLPAISSTFALIVITAIRSRLRWQSLRYGLKGLLNGWR